jgi:hypothetical protein
MKKFKVSIKIYGLSGEECRVIEVEAKTEQSAERKVSKIMGNREWYLANVEELEKQENES